MKVKRFKQINEDDDISYFSRYKDEEKPKDNSSDDEISYFSRYKDDADRKADEDRGKFRLDETEKSTTELEVELKKYKDCIKDIEYTLTHIKKEPYDYGEGADEAISEVMDLIARVKGGY